VSRRGQREVTSRQQSKGRQPTSQPPAMANSTTTVSAAPDPAELGKAIMIHQGPAGYAKESDFHGVSEYAITSRGGETSTAPKVQAKRPLHELPPTAVRRNSKGVEHPERPHRTVDGASSAEEHESGENASMVAKHDPRPVDIAAINGAIRDMLDSRPKKKAGNNGGAGEAKKKGRLVGRALSNLSNASSTSNVRRSREGSINSINTDGVGSELPATQSADNQSDGTASAAGKNRFSFTGRAKTTLTGLSSAALGMDDPDLARQDRFVAEQEAAPRMTQLGYEDPEEAVLLRQKLAASRGKRSKTDGAEEEGENQPADLKLATKQKPTDRKIRDDDIMAGAGSNWGAGRRTRHKQRSPPHIQEF
jgi:hypothetical protein